VLGRLLVQPAKHHKCSEKRLSYIAVFRLFVQLQKKVDLFRTSFIIKKRLIKSS
jgi:hypothetical protein